MLRIDVNTDALDLSSTPPAQVYSSLQQHITKLQVKCFTSMLTLMCYIGENNQMITKWFPVKTTFWYTRLILVCVGCFRQVKAFGWCWWGHIHYTRQHVRRCCHIIVIHAPGAWTSRLLSSQNGGFRKQDASRRRHGADKSGEIRGSSQSAVLPRTFSEPSLLPISQMNNHK